VGAFIIKLARHSNIHPIIAVAGGGQTYVETLIDRLKGDTIIDYRNGNEWVIESARAALEAAGLTRVLHAVDTVCQDGSSEVASRILSDGGSITLLDPSQQYIALPASISKTITYVGVLNGDITRDRWLRDQDQEERKEFGLISSRLFTKGLQDGWLVGHPYDVIPGGLNGISKGLLALKDGKVSAMKYIYRIAETSSKVSIGHSTS
jgi:NADPH2:quinone reductase